MSSTPSIALRLVLFLTAISLVVPTVADDDVLSKQRLQLMERAIGEFQITSKEIASNPALTFATKPLLRYSDPTRGLTEANVLLDASLWRLGVEGRPTALVTLEIYRSTPESGVLAYEFLSLTDANFALTSTAEKQVAWEATGSGLKLAQVPDSPEPAKATAARLTQMRQIARRFTVHETLNGEPIPCRLLPQPIDRYQSASANIVDGAIFAFANGTNPEAGLVLECDSRQWWYGMIRLSSAEAKMELDGREVASYPFFGDYGRRHGSYTSDSRPIDLNR